MSQGSRRIPTFLSQNGVIPHTDTVFAMSNPKVKYKSGDYVLFRYLYKGKSQILNGRVTKVISDYIYLVDFPFEGINIQTYIPPNRILKKIRKL